MKIELSFEEIINYVKHNYDRVVTLRTVSPQIVQVETDVKISLLLVEITKHINIKISIDNIIGSDLYINYITNLSGIEDVVAQKFIKNKLKKINSLALICEGDGKNNFVIHIGNIEKIKDIMEKIDILAVFFNKDDVVVEISIK